MCTCISETDEQGRCLDCGEQLVNLEISGLDEMARKLERMKKRELIDAVIKSTAEAFKLRLQTAIEEINILTKENNDYREERHRELSCEDELEKAERELVGLEKDFEDLVKQCHDLETTIKTLTKLMALEMGEVVEL